MSTEIRGVGAANDVDVAAVVVTYNRRDLLKECLDALLAQSVCPDVVVVVDNASTDGTQEMLDAGGYLGNPHIQYHLLDTNTGGAGGFCEGMRLALRCKPRRVWVMDDDTIPMEGALQGLLEAWDRIGGKIGFLASCVYGPDGEPMNVPVLSKDRDANGYHTWYMRLPYSAVKIQDATFVSLLFNAQAIQECGLPCADYFIWGDDTEYTMRVIRNYGPAYLVGSSVVCHKRYNAHALSLRHEDNGERVGMYHLFYRNNLINKRMYLGLPNATRFMLGAIRTSFQCLPTPHGVKKFRAVYRGIGEHFVQYGKFKGYVDGQLRVGLRD